MKKSSHFLQRFGIPHHEYWAWWILLAPLWPFWFLFGLRLGNFTWFTAVNPAIEDAGFLGESKADIFKLLPNEHNPKTFFINEKKTWNEIENEILIFLNTLTNKTDNIICIAKPDVGGRGRKIKIIKNIEELINYHESVNEKYMLQEFIPYDLELGVFYARMPNDESGKVISLTYKSFLEIIGDGKSTIEELMKKNKRSSLQLNRIGEKIDLNNIPKNEEKIILEKIGNHCLGTKFVNGADFINEHLHQTFDVISKNIPGFYYGRYDIKVSNWEDLYQGKNIFILELNGLTADPAHIFDAEFPLRNVFPTLWKHIRLAYKIAKQNLKNGVKTTPLFELTRKTFLYFKNN